MENRKILIDQKTKSILAHYQLDSSEFIRLLDDIAHVGTCIWQRGWAEANAGNLSIRLNDFGSFKDDSTLYLVSKTGSRYRQFGQETLNKFVFIQARGNQYTCLDPASRATSEWAAHLNLHNHFQKLGLDRSVVLHSHPDEVICLSHQAFFADKEAVNRKLKATLPELPLFLDTGIHICGLHHPGSRELAEASVCGLADEKALIWEKHGLLTFGASLDEAFDYMEVVVKAAKILSCLPS